jgi:MFS family permease
LALLFFFDGFSRRQLLILPTIGSILCALLVVFAIFIFTEKINPKCKMQICHNFIIQFIALPILASLDLCMAAIASESAYSVVPELFPQKDRVMGTALVGITQA